MPDDKRAVKTLSKSKIHNLILENREKLSVSGVVDVESFDEQCILLYVEDGDLTIKGEGLHINKLSVEVGELVIEGCINSCVYNDAKTKNKGSSLLNKLFR